MSYLNEKQEAEFAKLIKDGKSPDELKGWLIAKGVPFSKVQKFYGDLGGPKVERKFFRQEFYAWLIEAPRTAKQVEDKIKAEGSGNDVRHLTQYQGIAEVAAKIHAKHAK